MPQQKTHHRPKPSLSNDRRIHSIQPTSSERPSNRWCGCGVRASFHVPGTRRSTASCPTITRPPLTSASTVSSPRSHPSCLVPPVSSLLSHPSCLVPPVSSLLPRNPDTTDARFPGQGRHKGRSQDADAGDAMGSFQLESLNPNRSTLAITSRQSTRPPRNPRPASLARLTRLD